MAHFDGCFKTENIFFFLNQEIEKLLVRIVACCMADTFFSLPYISNSDCISHLLFPWDNSVNPREMTHGLHMLHMKWEVSMYCYITIL